MCATNTQSTHIKIQSFTKTNKSKCKINTAQTQKWSNPAIENIHKCKFSNHTKRRTHKDRAKVTRNESLSKLSNLFLAFFFVLFHIKQNADTDHSKQQNQNLTERTANSKTTQEKKTQT